MVIGAVIVGYRRECTRELTQEQQGTSKKIQRQNYLIIFIYGHYHLPQEECILATFHTLSHVYIFIVLLLSHTQNNQHVTNS